MNVKMAIETINEFMGTKGSYSNLEDIQPVWDKARIGAGNFKAKGRNMFQETIWRFKVFYSKGPDFVGSADRGESTSIMNACLIATARAVKEITENEGIQHEIG